ncbi:L-erythro-3,5-diaminohexanoate dehydrogenase [Geodermatophilus sabuli]|uniref:L-erythro-3,5-diaminohexanoate dehydrogenase n=1 Tax=Geodermatophilus sabuli TaxID=1564158 RepID=A0A285EEE4_9ACTN|nr:L-erythro-3,5-diaminohexanoate dehydrogenase [Geodermatophilus sabuli]MBB3084284.1 L-erythro-3,5-diaminohexanoate dehydrogenase [Geodermatophilus sabuli]SNX96446.1 L-erythro-3,5-diaminohexanoate dehydrogenase [Geodermatophilus sabuli]
MTAETAEMSAAARALGGHRVLDPPGVLPQAARRLDATPAIGPDEVRLSVQRLNLDAASFRQLSESCGGDGDAVRAAVLGIVAERGKMQNPVTGSGGMLIGVVDAVGPRSPLGLAVGQRVATLVSLTLTPLAITDGLARWEGRSEQVPAEGTAVLFARSIAAVLPDDLPDAVSLAVLDVCGAPAATARVVRRAAAHSVVVLGAAGKSGCLSLAAARAAGATELTGLVRDRREAAALSAAGLADRVVAADATDPLAVAAAVGTPAEVTVVCVDAPGAEHGAVLATADGGTVVFFSMATSFAQAALGAEGMAADVTMLIGNGYTPGHAALALDLYRSIPGVRSLIDPRVHA